MKKCARCGSEVKEEDIIIVNGQELCDDCSLILSMKKTSVPCDTNTGLRLTKDASKDESKQ